MRKYLVLAAALTFSVYMFGCGKKQAMEESQEGLTMEAMSSTNALVSQEVKPEAMQETPPAAPAVKIESLVSEAPGTLGTEIQIQTALKNAGFYAGEIDGKIGHKTKKAIEEFQRANNLKVDGKAGPNTWALLSAYLNLPVETQTKKKR